MALKTTCYNVILEKLSELTDFSMDQVDKALRELVADEVEVTTTDEIRNIVREEAEEVIERGVKCCARI